MTRVRFVYIRLCMRENQKQCSNCSFKERRSTLKGHHENKCMNRRSVTYLIGQITVFVKFARARNEARKVEKERCFYFASKKIWSLIMQDVRHYSRIWDNAQIYTRKWPLLNRYFIGWVVQYATYKRRLARYNVEWEPAKLSACSE
jgi:hypothetical protein